MSRPPGNRTGVDPMEPPGPAGWMRRLESEFLRPYRPVVALALAGLLVQSLLVLPVPLLQGWVLNQLVAHARGASPADSPSRAIALGLGLAAAGHLARMALSW